MIRDAVLKNDDLEASADPRALVSAAIGPTAKK
jgi:hypothetical protein